MTATSPFAVGDVVEVTYHDHASRPPRLERFTVGGVCLIQGHPAHEVDPRGVDGWYVNARSSESAIAAGFTYATIIRNRGERTDAGLAPWPGLWICAGECRLVERAQMDLLELLEVGA